MWFWILQKLPQGIYRDSDWNLCWQSGKCQGKVRELFLPTPRQHWLYCFNISALSVGIFDSLWPNDAFVWHRLGSKLAQVMACCLTAPSHYLNPCWPEICEALASTARRFHSKCPSYYCVWRVWKSYFLNYCYIFQGPWVNFESYFDCRPGELLAKFIQSPERYFD